MNTLQAITGLLSVDYAARRTRQNPYCEFSSPGSLAQQLQGLFTSAIWEVWGKSLLWVAWWHLFSENCPPPHHTDGLGLCSHSWLDQSLVTDPHWVCKSLSIEKLYLKDRVWSWAKNCHWQNSGTKGLHLLPLQSWSYLVLPLPEAKLFNFSLDTNQSFQKIPFFFAAIFK